MTTDKEGQTIVSNGGKCLPVVFGRVIGCSSLTAMARCERRSKMDQ